MATLETQNAKTNVNSTIEPNRGKALTTLDHIGAFSRGDGVQSGEDALSVLNRKLEAAGVLASGTANPVFANETALIYHQTTSGNLWIRGSSAYTEIDDSGTDTTIIPIYIDQANYPSINRAATWDGSTFNVPSTGTVDWSRSVPGSVTNTLWMRIYFLKGNNQIVFTDAIPIRQISAEDITYSPQGSGNIPSSVDNVKEGLDAFHTATLGGGGGGTGTDDQTAAEVPTTTSNFNNNLSNADTNVQRALDTLDNIDFPPEQRQTWPRHSGVVNATGVTQSFTVASNLVTHRTNYNEDLFIEAEADIRMGIAGTPGNDTGTFILDIQEASLASDPLVIEEAGTPQDGRLRLSGILPRTFTTGTLRVRQSATQGSVPLTGFEGFRIQIRSDVKADEVIVDYDDTGNNLTGDSDNLEEIISEIDELAIQPADYEDVPWPGGQNAIDDNGREVRPGTMDGGDPTYQITIHRNVENANVRPGINYIARITYDAVIRSGSGGSISALNFVHKTYAGHDTLTEIQSVNETTGRGVQRKTYDVTLPSNANSFTVGITNNAGQSDGRLLITNYQVNFIQGIDSSGFDGNLTISDNSAQKIAQAVDDLILSYLQKESLNNISATSSGVEPIAAPSQQITIRPHIVDEAGEKLKYDLSIRAIYDVSSVTPAFTGNNIGRIGIRSTNNFSSGTSYGEIALANTSSDRLQGKTITVEGLIPQSSNMPNTFYVVLEVVTNSNQYTVSLNEGFVVIERAEDIDDEHVIVDPSGFYDPNNFIGGLRQETGVSDIPDTPTNVQQALVKTDYLLQEAYNPFQETQLLDRFTGTTYTDSFTVDSNSDQVGPTRQYRALYSSPVDIAEEVRDLGVPIDVRVRVNLQSLGAGWAGDIALVSSDADTLITGTTTETVNTTIYSGANAPPTYIGFSRTIQAATAINLSTFRVRFRRTGGSTAATFDNGFVDIVDSAGAVMGGAGGQSSSYSSTIIWLAGASIYDRLTTASETTNHTLMSGHNFSDYDQLVFVFDGGSGSTQPLVPCWVDSNLFQAFGAAGTLWIVGNWWLMVSRQSDNTFRFRWRAPSNGLRRIIGITTN